MKTVFKYPLPGRQNKITTPFNPSFLHVGTDFNNQLCVWAQVDTAAPEWAFELRVYMTGEEIPHNQKYIGTAAIPLEGAIAHVYMTTPQ